jgi:hypothetical protein
MMAGLRGPYLTLSCGELFGLIGAVVLFLVFAVECAAVYWKRR